MKRFCLSAFLISFSLACGLFVSTDQDSNPVYVGNSVALIKSNQGYEELSMYIFVRIYEYYKHDTIPGKFAWIIPLPGRPEVSSPNYSVFEGLSKISAPVYKKGGYDYYLDCSYRQPPQDFYGKDYYEVLQYPIREPEIYDTIYAETTDTIINWLANQGISLSSQVQNLLQTYINKSWQYFYLAIFTAMFEGKVGVKLHFASSSEVLPMNIARANEFVYYHSGYYYGDYYYDGDEQISVYVYSISDHKRAYPSGALVYANSISLDELQNISDDFPNLGSELASGDYITKLKISYKEPDQSINEDIVLQQASDDDEYRELYESNDPIHYFAFDPVLLFLVCLMLRRKIRCLRNVRLSV